MRKTEFTSLEDEVSIKQEHAKGRMSKNDINIFEYLYKPLVQAIGFRIHGE
jgi:hypothetical protein